MAAGEGSTARGTTEEGGAGDPGVNGGADEAGRGGAEGGGAPDEGDDTGVRETGDLSGATSTHAGAGGVFDNTGGTGTAPTEG